MQAGIVEVGSPFGESNFKITILKIQIGFCKKNFFLKQHNLLGSFYGGQKNIVIMFIAGSFFP